jgi:zinc protease
MSLPKRVAKKQHSSFKHLGTYQGVEEYELTKNGLRVLYHYNNSAPVAGLMVTYLVGSRYEATGNTGATHILEHLMFKGTKKFPSKKGKSILEQFSQRGALVNASTWLDRTNYYEVLPDTHFEFAVQVEADRMRNTLITKKDLAEELPAVLSEYAMHAESSPVEFLDEQLWATSYIAHPYHHATIGWLSDIEQITVEKLQHFYDTYYHPNNAVVSVVGSIERSQALELIERHFGIHARSQHSIPRPFTKEPPQYGKRFIEVHRVGTKNVVGLAFKVPEALHADTPALTVLSAVLGDEKTSRLYKALVEKKLTSSVWINYMPFYDPSLFILYATPNEGVAHEEIERVFFEECEKILTKGITASELARVLAKVNTELAFARDGHYAILSSLNESIATGDWRFFFDLPKKVSKVTPEAVIAVAKKYLTKKTATVGYYRAEQQK